MASEFFRALKYFWPGNYYYDTHGWLWSQVTGISELNGKVTIALLGNVGHGKMVAYSVTWPPRPGQFVGGMMGIGNDGVMPRPITAQDIMLGRRR